MDRRSRRRGHDKSTSMAACRKRATESLVNEWRAVRDLTAGGKKQMRNILKKRCFPTDVAYYDVSQATRLQCRKRARRPQIIWWSYPKHRRRWRSLIGTGLIGYENFYDKNERRGSWFPVGPNSSWKCSKQLKKSTDCLEERTREKSGPGREAITRLGASISLGAAWYA